MGKIIGIDLGTTNSVVAVMQGGDPVKVLVLDHLVHSYNSLTNPQRLVYGYEFIYAALTEYLARVQPAQPPRTLFIGGGGYTFPRYVEARYPVGKKISGKVTNVVDYGAFVELEEGVEGLVHISEMSWTQRVKHPSKVVAIGDLVEVVVLDVDRGNKRISLGMRQAEPNPWNFIEERYPVGDSSAAESRSESTAPERDS